ncbi:MAG: carboxypeptidase regulatory-like domain-containing protein [Bacillota bacterium]|nr:carboxypeptidase regulatory-like domain-containing protein [Bacillota bacterium]
MEFDFGESTPSIKPDSQFSLNMDAGVKAVTNVNLKIKTPLGDPSIEGKWKLEHHFFEYNIEAAPSTLKGKVFKADYDRNTANNPVLSDVTVTAVRQGVSNAVPVTVKTNSQGGYTINNLTSGSYKLTFTKQGYADYSTTIDIDSDKTFNAILDVFGHSKLQGKITKADTDSDTTNNIPLTGASIQIKKLFSSSNITKNTISDTNGNYVFDELTAGLYEVTVTSQGYFTLTQDLIVYENQANVFNAMLEIISEAYAGSGTASGIITNALTGKGVESGLKLIIREGFNNTSEGEIITTLYTRSDGSYDVVLPAGYYCIQILDEREDSEGMVRYQSGLFNIKVLGAQDIGNQNGTVTPVLPDGQIRVVLKWGASPLDLDSHLVGPAFDGNSNFHIYYNNEQYIVSSDSGDVTYDDLDVDDTSSYGPETTTIYKQSDGVYKFYVHDYSNRYSNSSMGIADSGAIVEVYMGNTEKPAAVYNAPNIARTLWSVFEYDSRTKIIKGINTMTYESEPYNVGNISSNSLSRSLNIRSSKKK